MALMPLFGAFSKDLILGVGTSIAFILAFTNTIKPLSKTVGALFVLIGLSLKFGYIIDFKPIVEILAYGLMYSVVSREDAEKSLPVVIWVGVGLAMYGLLQFMGFESVFVGAVNNPNGLLAPSYNVCATMGNPTFLAPFLAMLIPLALKGKKYWQAILLGVVVLMTQSAIGIGAMVVSLFSIWFLGSRKKTIVLIGIGVLVILGAYLNPSFVMSRESGRFKRWNTMLQVHHKGLLISNGEQQVYKKYNLFGFGPGSFEKMFPKKMTNINFMKAHNEYLQIYWEFGILTMLLFIWFLFLQLWNGKDKFVKASILCICLNALGLFVWQLALIRFGSVYLLCLNKE